MTTFALKSLEFLPENPKMNFYQLLIDDNCPSDDFFAAMKAAGNQGKNLDKLQVTILTMAQDNRVPTKWFKELKRHGANDPHPDYELRAGQLRLYLFEDEEEGKIIVLGELKKQMKKKNKAIEKMRQIKSAYFAAKK